MIQSRDILLTARRLFWKSSQRSALATLQINIFVKKDEYIYIYEDKRNSMRKDSVKLMQTPS